MTPDLLPPRMAAKVRVTESGCWEWTGCHNNLGYSQVTVRRRMQSAHRVSYETLVGPIPPGLEIDHLCRVRGCINPAHLEPVTHLENMRRAAAFRVANNPRTQCVNGHELSESNFYLESDGHRRCRACRREQSRNRDRRKRNN